jgi:hypothetical protein
MTFRLKLLHNHHLWGMFVGFVGLNIIPYTHEHVFISDLICINIIPVALFIWLPMKPSNQLPMNFGYPQTLTRPLNYNESTAVDLPSVWSINRIDNSCI